jgi:hypothetical protein
MINKTDWERRRLACIKNHIVDLNDMVGVNYWERGQLARIESCNKINAGEPPALPRKNKMEWVYAS